MAEPWAERFSVISNSASYIVSKGEISHNNLNKIGTNDYADSMLQREITISNRVTTTAVSINFHD